MSKKAAASIVKKAAGNTVVEKKTDRAWVPANAVNRQCLELCARAHHAAMLAGVLAGSMQGLEFWQREPALLGLEDLLASLAGDLSVAADHAKAGRVGSPYPGCSDGWIYNGKEEAEAARRGWR